MTWRSLKQSSISLTMSEAENIALALLIQEIEFEQTNVTITQLNVDNVYTDSQSAVRFIRSSIRDLNTST